MQGRKHDEFSSKHGTKQLNDCSPTMIQNEGDSNVMGQKMYMISQRIVIANDWLPKKRGRGRRMQTNIPEKQ